VSWGKSWSRLNPFSRLRQTQALRGIHSVSAFRAILERERCRADRNEHLFSLIVFDVRSDNGRGSPTGLLAQVLVGRVRLTDEVGWYDRQHIGAVLPDTAADGALTLATEIRQTVAASFPVPTCMIYTYPIVLARPERPLQHGPRSALAPRGVLTELEKQAYHRRK